MSVNSHILIVDDDTQICTMMQRYLVQQNYQVSVAHNAVHMFEVLENTPEVSLIILDLMLPGEDGLSVASRLRASSDIGILMVTGKGETVDRIVGLEVGADDYLPKPFELRELLARVRSVLRRTQPRLDKPSPANEDDSPTGSIFRFNGWQLNQTSHSLLNPDGKPVELSYKQFKLLEIFVTNTRRVLSRDRLLDLLSDREWQAFDRSIDVMVLKLRKKIETDASQPSFIKTIRGTGYMFDAKVERG